MPTHQAVGGVEVDEAEVDLVAAELAPVVQPQDDLVLQQLQVDARHAALQASVELRAKRLH